MQLLNSIKKLFLTGIIAGYIIPANAQFIPKILDYTPAPGQYTNADNIGTPSAAASIIGTNKGLVSLGAFGGSITVYFPDGIKNDPANPYGIDFTIYGNATATWSEPGIIQVMKDENKNGIADDTWYEIAGSEHFWTSTNSNYAVTYQNNGLRQAGNIQWTDNQNQSGVIPVNSFHQQAYYPKADLFPTIPTDKYTLGGTRLTNPIDLSNPGQVISYHKTFGYADNTPVLSYTENLPDNPYTAAVEGSGGDAIDIDWAVDSNKTPVKLDEVNFIRIYTGMNAIAGWLGEISTEITGIRDVEPASASGMQSVVVIQEFAQKIAVGQSQTLNALLFEKGIPNPAAAIIWSVDNTELSTVQNGKLIAKKAGTIVLRATSASNPELFAEKTISLYAPAKAKITLQSNVLKVNDKLELTGEVTDQNGSSMTGINTNWTFDDGSVGEIVTSDGVNYLRGLQVGKSWLHFIVTDSPKVRDSVQVEVVAESSKKKVYISVKTSEKTIIPRHSVWVDQVDLTSKVDRTQKTYGLKDITFVSLAHAVAAAFKTAGYDDEWAFRDDAEGGSALYLWKVPSIEDGSINYTFGYGGSRTSDSYRRTWVVLLNQQQVVSGFDKIKVNNDDEILIYHLIDNNLPWAVTQLTSGKDSVSVGSSVEIQLKKYSCTMDANRLVSVNSSEIIAGQGIVVQSLNNSGSKVNLTSDELGKAVFPVGSSGSFLISSGIDIANLFAGLVTGNQLQPENTMYCQVFPNPFTTKIKISSSKEIESILIYNPEGQLIVNLKGNHPEIDLGNLSSGLYLIQVVADKQVFCQKIVKK
jgi:hypothetical protein